MGRKQPESKTSKRRLKAREREQEVLELRKLGLPYRVIAERLGLSDQSSACKIAKRALGRLEDETKELAAELRRLESERLDQLLVAVIPKAAQGHLGAIDRALKIMERRSRLWGLDAASAVKLHGHFTGPEGGPVTFVERRLAGLDKLTDEELARLQAELMGERC